MNLEEYLYEIELICERPLYNQLESGFRHSDLTDKEKIKRYEEALFYIKDCVSQIRQLTNS